MKIGITGATGFIGKAIARRAVAAGHTVHGLDLAPDTARIYESAGCTYQQAGINDSPAVKQFCQGLDRIYHTAAIVKETGDWSLFRKVNVEGARSVAAAAKAAGVAEFIHFSSVMVYGFDFHDGVTESGPLDGAENPYCTSKIEAETALLPLHQSGVFDLYVIRPGDVYGPGSIPWTLRPVEMMRANKWIYVDAHRAIFNHVYIDNLLDGIDRILEAKASGRPFNLTDGRRTTVHEFFSHYQRMLGKRFIPNLPGNLALAAAGAIEKLNRIFDGPTDVNRAAVRYMLRSGQYSCEAVKALGYNPAVSLEEGMAACRKWLREEGLILR